MTALGELTVRTYTALPGAVHEPDYHEVLRDVSGRAAQVPVLVAVDGERLVGSITYVPGPGPFAEPQQLDDEAGIRMLVVDPAAQGRGVGRALVEHAVARAQAEGRAGVSLYSTAWMTVAHSLYERLGFVRAPDRDLEIRPDLVLCAYVLRFDGRAVPSAR